MAIYKKVNGAWVEVKRPYVKRNNIMTPAQAAYRKVGGVWRQAYQFDRTPSAVPQMSLEIRDNRFIRVGVKLPARDPELQMIRVMATRQRDPGTQFGEGYIQEPDVNWPNETWSDWYYNGMSPLGNSNHGNEAAYDFKEFPPNPSSKINLPGGEWYKFGAWSMDRNGNWSAGTTGSIYMPKDSAPPPPKVQRVEANFVATAEGTATKKAGTSQYTQFEHGKAIARNSGPRSLGFWFYNGINSSIGPAAEIKHAAIRLSRTSNDFAPATADVNLFWHEMNSPSDFPFHEDARKQQTKIGTLNRGEAKWFNIPPAWYPALKHGAKGFGISNGPNSNDQWVAKELSGDAHSGLVNIVWEKPS